MDFRKFARGETIVHPYACRQGGEWFEGEIEVRFLEKYFGHCEDLDECIASTDVESLKLLFEQLKQQQ